ncbi:unnamed protein product [Merluccius merluccius]
MAPAVAQLLRYDTEADVQESRSSSCIHSAQPVCALQECGLLSSLTMEREERWRHLTARGRQTAPFQLKKGQLLGNQKRQPKAALVYRSAALASLSTVDPGV